MTTYINFFGGPGIGKSTIASGLYWYMKTSGDPITVELISEYAKEKIWLGETAVLLNQTYVSSKQYHRMHMVDGKVDYAITDSPLLVGLVYGKYPSTFPEYLLSLHNTFDNINILLNRCIPYDQVGRDQTEEEAKEKDIDIVNFLNRLDVPYYEFNECGQGLDTLVKLYSLIKKIQNK